MLHRLEISADVNLNLTQVNSSSNLVGYLAVIACYYLGKEIDVFILTEEAANFVSPGYGVSTHLENADNKVSQVNGISKKF